MDVFGKNKGSKLGSIVVCVNFENVIVLSVDRYINKKRNINTESIHDKHFMTFAKDLIMKRLMIFRFKCFIIRVLIKSSVS